MGNGNDDNENNNNKNNNKNNRGVVDNRRTRPTRAYVDPRDRKMPRIGEVRYHGRTGLLYVYEQVPGKDKLGWVRLDTWVFGGWRGFPWRTADARSLRKINRARLGLDKGHDVTYVHITAE